MIRLKKLRKKSMVNFMKKVEKLCTSCGKNLCIKCEKNCSNHSIYNFTVQKSFISPTFSIFFTSFSTKNLICLIPIFSTIPHSLNTTIINIFKKEV